MGCIAAAHACPGFYYLLTRFELMKIKTPFLGFPYQLLCFFYYPFLVGVALRVVVDVVAEYGGTFFSIAPGQVNTAACGFVDDGDRAVLFYQFPPAYLGSSLPQEAREKAASITKAILQSFIVFIFISLPARIPEIRGRFGRKTQNLPEIRDRIFQFHCRFLKYVEV